MHFTKSPCKLCVGNVEKTISSDLQEMMTTTSNQLFATQFCYLGTFVNDKSELKFETELQKKD